MPVIDRVAAEDALERVRTALGDKASDLNLNHGSVDFRCAPQDFVQVMTALRDDVGCEFFTFLSGIDWSEFADNPGPLEVFAHVYGPTNGIHVTVHVLLEGENPTCPTITGVYRGALWHERECFEMFGIHFEGHPLLVNLYLPEDFEGHPLLKSFKLPGRSFVKDWPGAKDPDEAAAGGR